MLESDATFTSTSDSIYNDPNLHDRNLKILAHPNNLNTRGSALQRESRTAAIFLKSLLNFNELDSVAINHLGLYLTATLQSLLEKQPEP